MNASPDHPEAVLARVNQRLSELLHRPAPELSAGGEQALADRLWVWGILGGKDVGKSTLINVLSGRPLAGGERETAEGTRQATAYLTASDAASLRARLSGREALTVHWAADAPDRMNGLVLVDLPDFDSIYSEHLEQVHHWLPLLDGVIWVTTPKKVGDRRGMDEIEGVLKARTNFVYVVNKIDWLLGQTDRPPEETLSRLRSGLRAQVPKDADDGWPRQCFLVSAKYTTVPSLLKAIRGSNGRGSRVSEEALAAAADETVREFDALQRHLTTAPAARTARHGKNANLAYQSQSQARQLLRHYQPQKVRARLEEAAGDDALRELVGESITPGYCARVLTTALQADRLIGKWSSEVFYRRLAYWSVLDILVWPIVLLGRALSGLRDRLGGFRDSVPVEVLRLDGISLEERLQTAVSGVQGRLLGAARPLNLEWPTAGALTSQFEMDLRTLVNELCRGALAPLLARRPRWTGRVLRRLAPPTILLWFPLVQPFLAAATASTESGWRQVLFAPLVLVRALSASNVLLGLLVTVFLLVGLAAAVYGRAVRATLRCVDELQQLASTFDGAALIDSLVRSLGDPARKVSAELDELTNALTELAGPRGAASDPACVGASNDRQG